MTQLMMISPAKLTPSPTNPRRDLGDLTELIESLRQHGMIEPIVAREGRTADEYEVVCGHRRHAAAQVIGPEPVPVLVRELDDDQVLDIQLAENMERSDLTAFEEAEAFQLRVSRGQTVERIAARIGRSAGFVAQRLKLLELHPEVQQALREEAISVSVAQLLGRLPADLQERALEDVQVGPEDRVRTVAEAKAELGRILRRLDRAPFDVADPSLGQDEEHGARGACTTCPMRSGNQGRLFDADEEDYCLDEPCYRAKCSAMARRAELAGKPVLRGQEAATALQSWGGDWVRLDTEVWIEDAAKLAAFDDGDDDVADDVSREISVRELLAESDHEPTLAFNEETGTVAEVVPRHVVDAAVARAEGREPEAPPDPGGPAKQNAAAKREEKEKLRKRAIDAYIKQAAGQAVSISPDVLLGLLVRALARQTEHTSVLRVLKRLGINPGDEGARIALSRHAGVVLPSRLPALALHLVLENAAPWFFPLGDDGDDVDEDHDTSSLWDDAQRVVSSLELLDVRGVEKELVKADKAKAKKKAPAKRAKKSGGAA
ncbi:MAG: ParB/RepB/Spo0J family partition protein [Polyangiaceae bacterium]|nr:ParB/RepB/Spo0J family partition protein [Polyangiaceae bacterium]